MADNWFSRVVRSLQRVTAVTRHPLTATTLPGLLNDAIRDDSPLRLVVHGFDPQRHPAPAQLLAGLTPPPCRQPVRFALAETPVRQPLTLLHLAYDPAAGLSAPRLARGDYQPASGLSPSRLMIMVAFAHDGALLAAAEGRVGGLTGPGDELIITLIRETMMSVLDPCQSALPHSHGGGGH